MTAIDTLNELNEWLKENGNSKQVGFTCPVRAVEIDDTEQALKVKLPSTYVNFVTTHGAFYIDGDLTGRGSGNDTKLFTPKEVLEETQRY